MMLNIIILIDCKSLAELTYNYKAQASKFLIFGQMLNLIEKCQKFILFRPKIWILKIFNPIICLTSIMTPEWYTLST